MIGLDAIYYLTRTNKKLSVYLEAHDGDSGTANYSTFYIAHADFDYKVRDWIPQNALTMKI